MIIRFFEWIDAPVSWYHAYFRLLTGPLLLPGTSWSNFKMFVRQGRYRYALLSLRCIWKVKAYQ